MKIFRKLADAAASVLVALVLVAALIATAYAVRLGWEVGGWESGGMTPSDVFLTVAVSALTSVAVTLGRFGWIGWRARPRPVDVEMLKRATEGMVKVATSGAPAAPLGPTPTGAPLKKHFRDRPEMDRRDDPDDPLCARPGCTIESWYDHKCVMGPPVGR